MPVFILYRQSGLWSPGGMVTLSPDILALDTGRSTEWAEGGLGWPLVRGGCHGREMNKAVIAVVLWACVHR